MFLGIPYANVDVNNPFGDSIPHPKFEQVLEAFNDTTVCPQIQMNKTVTGNLNCLHLNVFVPTYANSSSLLPVLFWIHGGSFQVGSNDKTVFGPKFLVKKDILLVTINYRLGVYGFMCPETPEVPGNQGLKDQLAALKWVKNNIEAFGGDSEKITIAGESAGAASIDLYFYTNYANLFQKAILESGVSLSPWALEYPGKEGPLKLAKHLGYATDNVNEGLTYPGKLTTNLIINATEELGLSFKICVEWNFENVENVLTDYPVNLKSAPRLKNIPVLIGFNSDEELLNYANEENLDKINIIKRAIDGSFDMEGKTYDEMSEILRHFYFGDKDINNDTKREVIDLATDFNYSQPIQRSLDKYLDNDAKVYSYVFSYVGERNFGLENRTIEGGAAHTDELGYLFNVAFQDNVTSEDVMIDRMTSLWTNFVKYGDPTPELTDVLPVKWIPVTKDRWNYLDIDSELTLENRPFNRRLAFLDLIFKTNEEYLIGYRDRDDIRNAN